MSFSKIKALSWDPDFKDFIYKSGGKMDIQIHSIFNRVINIISNENIIYTISNINTDNAPYTLRIDFNGSFNEIISKDDKIIIENGSILLGNMKIYLRDAILWSPKIKRIKDYSTRNIKKNIEIFNRLIIDNGESGGCKDFYLKYFLNISGYITSPMEEQLSKRIDIFYKNLLANNLEEDHIKNLIGLGIGLTPSGDDFLTGFLASIYAFEENKELHKKIDCFIQPLVHSTTDISSAMLKAAIEGKYRESLKQFIYSFLESEENIFVKYFNNLLEIGSSSGTDMSIGVLLGLLYTIKNY